MKLTFTGVAAFAAAKAYAFNICSEQCGDNCEEDYDQVLANYDYAGFEDVEECEAHQCTLSFNSADSTAQWHECEEGSRELDGRKYNHIVKMTKSQITTNHSLKKIHKMIQNYGCHCFPGQERAAGGHGPAVDAQDSLCRDLSRCHRCITMEYGADVIDVDMDKYRFRVVNGDINCERNTVKGWHQSKRDLCECDARFAREMGKIWNDNTFNDYYWLMPKDMRKKDKGKLIPDKPKFDITATCVGNESGKANNCCGTYPERYPYNSADQKGCCGNSGIFNTVINVCCPGDQIATPGDC